MVANEQSAAALPAGCRGQVIKVVESGVDLSIWSQDHSAPRSRLPNQPIRFVFSGRFVDWKGVQYLVPAFFNTLGQYKDCVLELIGSGEFAPVIEKMVAESPLKEHVKFHGWLPQSEAARIVRECHVFVLPSLRECGGAVILEAMAMGKPVIAANWAGPANYINDTCGILVEPSSEEAFIDGLSKAMLRLAQSDTLRTQLGEGGKNRVRQEYFDWDSKADRVLEIFSQLVRADGMKKESQHQTTSV